MFSVTAATEDSGGADGQESAHQRAVKSIYFECDQSLGSRTESRVFFFVRAMLCVPFMVPPEHGSCHEISRRMQAFKRPLDC
jgi:hypothetical protein